MSNYGQQPPYGQPNPYGPPAQPYGQLGPSPYAQTPPTGQPSYAQGYPPGQVPWPPPRAGMARRALVVVTMDAVPGRVVTSVLGDVLGVVARVRELPPGLRGGNPLDGYAQMLTTSRQAAVDKMAEMAVEAGADAVVGLRYDCSEITQSLSEVSAYGTAVTLNTVEPPATEESGGAVESPYARSGQSESPDESPYARSARSAGSGGSPYARGPQPSGPGERSAGETSVEPGGIQPLEPPSFDPASFDPPSPHSPSPHSPGSHPPSEPEPRRNGSD